MKELLALTTMFAVYLQVEACGQLIKSGVTCEEKQAAIDAHNGVRMKLANGQIEKQPKAANMNRLVWDDALAEVAQNWANQMNTTHNAGRKDSRFYVGENIHILMDPDGTMDANDTSNKVDFQDAVESWFEENTVYNYEPYVFDPNTGHYTQLAWAETKYVGCGYVCFFENELYIQMVVCDYGPGGNMPGQNIYNKGAGCENLCCQEQCSLPNTGESCKDNCNEIHQITTPVV